MITLILLYIVVVVVAEYKIVEKKDQLSSARKLISIFNTIKRCAIRHAMQTGNLSQNECAFLSANYCTLLYNFYIESTVCYQSIAPLNWDTQFV